MRRAFIWLSIFGSVIISATSGSPIAAQELSAARCQALLAELQPSGDEAWRTIPWKIDLLDAQRSAAQQHKPIFIWAMDGHPLGCT